MALLPMLFRCSMLRIQHVIVAFALLVVSGIAIPISAQVHSPLHTPDNGEPWEKSDVQQKTENDTPPVFSDFLIKNAIEGYQSNAAVTSVSRCPFSLSCSNYAVKAISRYSLIVGMVLFIDRYFYRENALTSLNYPLGINSSGIIKRDDSYFLHLDEE